jgi:hypothetical protein
MECMGINKENGTDKKKRPGWVKPVELILRSCHIGVTSVLFGGVVFAVPFMQLYVWHNLAIATGCALIVSGVCQSRHWIYQGRGITAILHVGLLGLIHLRPEFIVPVLSTVLVLGVIGSNMPGYIRHYSLVHGQRID